MAEEDLQKNESEASAHATGSEGAVRPDSGRYVTVFLGCLVAALAVVLVVTVLFPSTDETSALPEPGTALDPQVASTPIPADSQTPKAPVSTIRLPAVAIPATAEQLQQEAEGVAEALCQTHPDLPEALHVAAMLASQTRHSEEAEKLWRRCIELDPKQVTYYVNLAAIAMDRGDSQMAADILRQAIQAGCESPDVHHHLAVALHKLGQCEEAEQVILKALAVYPQSAAYRLVLGQAQLKAGKVAEAETNLRLAIDQGSATASAYFALASACTRLGKQEEAAKYRQRFAELKAETPMDKQRRFEILSTAESRRTAVTILCEAAAVHQQQRNPLESERLLHRAIAIDPSSATPCHLLADLYGGAGMIAEARVVWSRLVELEPFHLPDYLMLAQCCAQLGEREAAEATLKLAVAMRPEAVEGYATLAQFYLEGGHADRARWFAQEAIRREPSAAGYEFLASVCRLVGDEDASKAAHDNAIKLSAAAQPPQGEGEGSPAP